MKKVDVKIILFLQLWDCKLIDNVIYRNEKIVGKINLIKSDIKKILKGNNDIGNLRLSYPVNDSSDVQELLFLELDTFNFKTASFNCMQRKLEFNGIANRNYNLRVEIDTNEVKIKFDNDFLSFHIVNRVDADTNNIIQCCNCNYNQEYLYYKSVFNGYEYLEELYHTNYVNEKCSGSERSLVKNLFNPETQKLLNEIQTHLEILFEKCFFQQLITSILDDKTLTDDFSFLGITPNKKYILK